MPELRRSARAVVGTLFCAWTAAFTVPAAAQETDQEVDARAHFASARLFFDDGRYEEAAGAFLESYRLYPLPEMLDNAALAYERSLRLDDAIATLERLLTEHPDYERATPVRARIAHLESVRARLAAGEEPAVAGETVDDPPAEEGGLSVPGLVVTGLGVALGAAALITGLVSHGMFEDVESRCVDRVCDPSVQGDIDTGRTLGVVSTALTVAAVAAVGVGVVLLALGAGGDESDPSLVAGPGDVGLALAGRF